VIAIHAGFGAAAGGGAKPREMAVAIQMENRVAWIAGPSLRERIVTRRYG
jgi:hypothetical protein